MELFTNCHVSWDTLMCTFLDTNNGSRHLLDKLSSGIFVDFGGIGDVEETKTLIRDVRASKITEEPEKNKNSEAGKKKSNDSSVKARRRSERKRKNKSKKLKKQLKKKTAKKAAMKKKKGSKRLKKKIQVKQLDKEAKQAGTINEACVKVIHYFIKVKSQRNKII